MLDEVENKKLTNCLITGWMKFIMYAHEYYICCVLFLCLPQDVQRTRDE